MQFPIAKKAAYEKFKHPASGFALVGVFVSKRGSDIRVAVTGAGSNGVFRVTSFEEALKKRFSPKSIEGMTIPADGMNTDIHGSAEYRAHLVARAGAPGLGEGVAVRLRRPIWCEARINGVMPGLVPGIHVLGMAAGVDGRDKPRP